MWVMLAILVSSVCMCNVNRNAFTIHVFWSFRIFACKLITISAHWVCYTPSRFYIATSYTKSIDQKAEAWTIGGIYFGIHSSGFFCFIVELWKLACVFFTIYIYICWIFFNRWISQFWLCRRDNSLDSWFFTVSSWWWFCVVAGQKVLPILYMVKSTTKLYLEHKYLSQLMEASHG
jgi:hypothetical protein